MTNINLRSSELADNHLSPEEMYDYIENKLPEAARHELEVHLLECDLCHDALAGITLAPKDKTFPNLLEINKRIKTRTTRRQKNNTLSHIKNWGLTTGIIFLVIFAAIMVWFEVRRETFPASNPEKAIQIPPDKAAEPVGGFSAYQKYVNESLGKFNKNNISKPIVISFTVNPDSTLSGFATTPVIKNQSFGFAVKIILKGPIWVPAQKAGKHIPQKVSVTIASKR